MTSIRNLETRKEINILFNNFLFKPIKLETAAAQLNEIAEKVNFHLGDNNDKEILATHILEICHQTISELIRSEPKKDYYSETSSDLTDEHIKLRDYWDPPAQFQVSDSVRFKNAKAKYISMSEPIIHACVNLLQIGQEICPAESINQLASFNVNLIRATSLKSKDSISSEALITWGKNLCEIAAKLSAPQTGILFDEAANILYAFNPRIATTLYYYSYKLQVNKKHRLLSQIIHRKHLLAAEALLTYFPLEIGEDFEDDTGKIYSLNTALYDILHVNLKFKGNVYDIFEFDHENKTRYIPLFKAKHNGFSVAEKKEVRIDEEKETNTCWRILKALVWLDKNPSLKHFHFKKETEAKIWYARILNLTLVAHLILNPQSTIPFFRHKNQPINNHLNQNCKMTILGFLADEFGNFPRDFALAGLTQRPLTISTPLRKTARLIAYQWRVNTEEKWTPEQARTLNHTLTRTLFKNYGGDIPDATARSLYRFNFGFFATKKIPLTEPNVNMLLNLIDEKTFEIAKKACEKAKKMSLNYNVNEKLRELFAHEQYSGLMFNEALQTQCIDQIAADLEKNELAKIAMNIKPILDEAVMESTKTHKRNLLSLINR